jgi:4'-phosphopantetheinyl transferase
MAVTPLADPLVWLVDAAAVPEPVLAHYAAWLGASERARCARFVRAERRRQFILGRALLRLALGRLLARDPSTIALTERPGQAPSLPCAPALDGCFSISHSGPWVACAASAHTRLGLDIERIDPARDVLALAEHAFDAAELAALRSCAAGQQHAAFYRMWCAHEAGIKLGAVSAIDYPLAAPGLAGALACGAPLTAPPRLVQVRLDQL